jgi:cold shock CspA family protein
LITGKLSAWFADRSFGFLRSPETERDTFVHLTELRKAGVERPVCGEEYRYIIEEDVRTRRLRAVDLELVISQTGGEAG